MPTKEERDQTSSFKRWYANNKQPLSESRKTRYQTDTAYRDGIKQRQRERQKANRGTRLLPSGERVQVFRLSAVATECGVSKEVFIRHEEQGDIPTHTLPGKHRSYTEQQKALLIAFFSKKLSSESLFTQWE